MRPWILALVSLLPACSLVRAPITAAAEDAGLDGGGLDGPGLDAPIAMADVPVRIDVPLDTPSCVPSCRGEVADDCIAPPRDCAATDLVCRNGTAGPECVCEDAAPRCATDGRAAEGCDDGEPTIVFCDTAGCSGGSCVNDCPAPVVGSGSHRIDLCAEGSDNLNAEVTGACEFDADGEDALRRIVLTARSRVTITVRDADPARNVDTLVHLRGECDSSATQLACDDDVPCDEAAPGLGACSGPVQRRESRIEVELGRGVYFVIADSLDYTNGGTTWSCGMVDLVVEVEPA